MTATTTAPAVFTRAEAKEADRILNELMFVTAKKDQSVAWAEESVRRLVDRETGWGRARSWGKTLEQAFEEVRIQAATVDAEKPWVQSKAQEELDDFDEAMSALNAARLAEANQAALWARHGQWLRYNVVPGGHIHSGGVRCHTLRPTTDVRWAHPVSGDSVDEAIEVYGDVLCTHCFPDAPVENCGGKVSTDEQGNPLTKAEAQAIKDARDAEKAAKQAAKDAKTVFVPGTRDLVQGADLRDIKTERSLVTAIVDTMYSKYGDRLDGRDWSATKRDRKTGEVVGIDESYPTYREWLAYAINALAVKQGKTVAEVQAEMDKKLIAKNRRG